MSPYAVLDLLVSRIQDPVGLNQEVFNIEDSCMYVSGFKAGKYLYRFTKQPICI